MRSLELPDRTQSSSQPVPPAALCLSPPSALHQSYFQSPSNAAQQAGAGTRVSLGRARSQATSWLACRPSLFVRCAVWPGRTSRSGLSFTGTLHVCRLPMLHQPRARLGVRTPCPSPAVHPSISASLTPPVPNAHQTTCHSLLTPSSPSHLPLASPGRPALTGEACQLEDGVEPLLGQLTAPVPG